MGGLPSFNGVFKPVFKPVFKLASYITYCLALLLKTGLPRFWTCVTFSVKIFKGLLGKKTTNAVALKIFLLFCMSSNRGSQN